MEDNYVDTRLGGDALRILVVEHHQVFADALLRYLRYSGHSVELATCTRSAWAAVRARDFDVLLTDVWLPDGICVALVQQGYPRRPRFVVTMSGFKIEGEVLEELGGARRHLLKPFDPGDLGRMLEGFVTEREVERMSHPGSAFV